MSKLGLFPPGFTLKYFREARELSAMKISNDLKQMEFDIGVAVPTRCLMVWRAGSSDLRSCFKRTFQSLKTARAEYRDTNCMTLYGTFVHKSNYIAMNIISMFSFPIV